MKHLKKAIQFILSEEYLNFVTRTGKWCHHGSKTIHYFEDEDLVLEYANSRERKSIVKEYIRDKIENIEYDIEDEKPDTLYRAVYLKEKPSEKDFFGFFWSSKPLTAPCVKKESNLEEYLLEIDFNDDVVDWKETLMSRMDFVYGDREKEFYLKDIDVSLSNSTKI